MAILIEKSYGVNDRVLAETEVDVAVESLRTLGYAIIDGGYTISQLAEFSEIRTRAQNSRKDSRRPRGLGGDG